MKALGGSQEDFIQGGDGRAAVRGEERLAILPVARLQIGEVLVARGLISSKQLDEAIALQGETSRRYEEILYDFAPNEAERICEVVAEALDVPYVRPDRMDIAEDVLALVPAGIATHYAVLPIEKEGRAICLATTRPDDVEFLDELELLTGHSIVPYLAMPKAISDGIKKHYGVGADTIHKMRAEEGGALVLEDPDQHSLDDETGDASIIRFVNQVIMDAQRLGATDVHFEPQENSFRIRYRIDGLLEEISVPQQIKQYQSVITSRLKVMAHLDIAEHRLPQDGRIPVRTGDEAFDLRVSVLPTPFGEAVNLRLLRRTNIHLTLEELGYSKENLTILESAAQRPNGIILVTGPTGSGKTTSLYALMDKINTLDRKIITIEDPIEYNLAGMLQMQVHEEIGFTFARASRSILRHDPDIVLVGEIRDPETAEIAIRMAMTGHLVLSTLHTNDAASTIARLIDMGQEPYLLASTIACVVSQRLVRVICAHCKTPWHPPTAMLVPFQEMGLPMPEVYFRGTGCERCRKSGYSGRTGIHEAFPITEEFRTLIMERAPASAFRELAKRKGIRQMREEGWERVLVGITTINEILRVTAAVETT